MFNAISKHFQSEDIPEKLADYMSHNLTIQIHQSAVELAGMLREEFGEPTIAKDRDCDCAFDGDYICPSCMSKLREQHKRQYKNKAR